MGEFILIENIIEDKTVNYIKKHLESPNFLKVPLWVYENMKIERVKLTTKNIRIDYQKELVTYRGLVICPTISIEYIDEIEVF